MAEIEIYTDGSSRGNPGPGGIGVILMWNNHRKEISIGFRLTTNNRMELLAVITGLESNTKKELPVIVYSDSQYVEKAIEEGWLNNWIKTDFKGGKKNKDLWTRYYHLSRNMKVKMKWVKGHAVISRVASWQRVATCPGAAGVGMPYARGSSCR